MLQRTLARGSNLVLKRQFFWRRSELQILSDEKTPIPLWPSNYFQEWKIYQIGESTGTAGVIDDPDFEGRQMIHFSGKVVFKPTVGALGSFCGIKCFSSEPVPLLDYEGLEIVVKSDFAAKLTVLASNDFLFVNDLIYQTTFDLPPNEWMIAQIPFGSMRGTRQGRDLEYDSGIKFKALNSIGLVFRDNQDCDFSIQVRSIAARYELRMDESLIPRPSTPEIALY